jgi:hypothetical protein
MATESKWRFLRVCPSCSEKTAVPVKISDYTKTLVGVWVRCESCASEWVLTADIAPVMLKVNLKRQRLSLRAAT